MASLPRYRALNAMAPRLVRSLEDSLRAERGQVLVIGPLSRRPCAGSVGTFRAWWRETAEPDGRDRLLFGGGRSRDAPDSLFRQFDAAGRPHPKLQSEDVSPS